MQRPGDSILQHLLKPEANPEGDVKRYQQCLFKGQVNLTKYPKIHVKSFKLLMLRASELHFATLSAWSWPWRWYHKIPIISIQRASILNKIPKIHANSFKTVDVRASTLHISTPPWAWRWPWGLYHKIPIMSFQRASMLNKIPITLVKSFIDVRASRPHFPSHPWTWSWHWGWY